MCCKSSVHRKNIISYCYSKVNIISYCYSKVNEHMSKIYSMLYQTHAFDAKLDHNGCVRYIRLIFNGYCFVGDAVFCQCRICRFSLCAGSKDDVSGVPFSFRHIAFIELFLISYFYYLETPKNRRAAENSAARLRLCFVFIRSCGCVRAPFCPSCGCVRVLPAGMPYFLRSSRRASTALLICSLFSAWS